MQSFERPGLTPRAVVQPSQSASPCGMSHLRVCQSACSIEIKYRAYLSDVAWSTDASEAHPEPKDEAARQKHPPVDRWSLNAGTDDHYDCTREHAGATSEMIIYWTAKQDGWDASNVVDRKRNTSAAASRVPIAVRIGDTKISL